MPNGNWIVTSSDDNAQGSLDGTFNNGATDMFVRARTPGASATQRSRCVGRMENVTIPPGATITSAVVKVTGRTITSSDLAAVLGFELAPDGADFATRSTATDIWAITMTSSPVTWIDNGVSIGVTITSPDVSAGLQEVIDNGGWSSGMAVVVVIEGRTDVTENAAIRGYGAALPIALLVEWDDPPPRGGWISKHKFRPRRRHDDD